MIQTKKLIPKIYSNSYDMSIFTGLLDLLYNSREVNIQLLKGAHSPSYCAEGALLGLSSLFNLNTDNRELIAKYRELIKVKGTVGAIEATALLCGAGSVSSIDMVTSGEVVSIEIGADLSSMDCELFYEMMRRLSPFSTIIKLEPAD